MAEVLLVCVDFSPGTDAVLAVAARLASSSGARVVLVHAGAPEPDFVGYDRPGGPNDAATHQGELRSEHHDLEALAERLRADGIDAEAHLVEGPTTDVLLDQAEKHHATLVVVGTHGHRALHRFIVGSTTDALIRRSPVPLVVVPVHEE
jgi:nucleotide-binding universal stress UspA family protein